MKQLPQPPLPEHDPQYRQLQPEYAEALRKAGPKRYAFASAHLFATPKQPKRRRFAVM